MGSNSPSVTFGQVILIAPDNEALTTNIKSKLIEVWGEMPASEIGVKTVFDMAYELLAILPDPDFNNDVRFRTAEAVHSLFKRMGFADDGPQQTVKVTFDKTPDQMSLRELLEALTAQPNNYAELRSFIEAHHQVREATRKSNGAWVIKNPTGSINVEQTLDYVTQLSKRFASAQREFKNQRPVTLAKALGIDDRALIHPFTGRPVQGPDDNGFDLSTLDPELHEALLWAADTCHSAWPRQIDLYTYTEEVLTTPLPRRWQRILSDYQYAKESDDTVRPNRYWPENVPFGQTLNLTAGFLGTTTGQRNSTSSNTNYQQILLEMAQASCKQSGMASRVNGGVYRRINVSGMSAMIDGVIVLEGGVVSGMSSSGTIYAPPGVSIQVTGMSASVQVINLTWEKLAQRAKLV